MKCTHCGGEMYTKRWHLGQLAVAQELRCADCGAQRLRASLDSAEVRGAATAFSAFEDSEHRPRRHRHLRVSRAR